MKTLTLLLTLLLGSLAWAQTLSPPPVEGSLLPALPGQVAPGPEGTVLVVFRSADW